MLTEQFINSCGASIFQKSSKYTPAVFSDIFYIMSFYKEDSIPLESRQKFSLVQTLSKLKVSGKSSEEILDSIFATGKYNDLSDYISQMASVSIPEDKAERIIKNITDRKKLSSILKGLPIMEDFVKKINSNSFSDMGEPIKHWENIISEMYNTLSEERRKESIVNITSLDMVADGYSNVLDQIEQNYQGLNSISSGYATLDKYMHGGFEPTRLYIFSGASGDGKSALLMNMLKNAVKRRKEESNNKDIYLYFTLENLIDESFVRLYCSLTEREYDDVIGNLKTEREQIERTFKEWQVANNAVVIMSYFPATVTSVSDLLGFMEKVKEKYKGTGTIKAIYLDYLDLLRAGQTFDLYRLEQGQVTIDLKVAAVINRIPIITVTQVNRGGYDQKSAMSLTNMSESMKKVEHSDFVAILRAIVDENEINNTLTRPAVGKMQLVIAKNRCGPKNKEIQFITRFSKFLVKERANEDIPLMEIAGPATSFTV